MVTNKKELETGGGAGKGTVQGKVVYKKESKWIDVSKKKCIKAKGAKYDVCNGWNWRPCPNSGCKPEAGSYGTPDGLNVG